MKVPSNTTQTNAVPEKRSSPNDPESLAGDLELDGVSEKPSFASVLDRVTHSRRDSKLEDTGTHSKEPSTLQPARTKQKDEEEADAVVVVPERVQASEPIGSTDPTPDVHAILHTEDLEKIVAACRVAIVGGRPEVQLDLSHSVLDGLRVKVSADSMGRITTEFLAGNEGVKSLIDSRSSELIALLRSRGINEVNFSSSLAAESYTSNSGSRREPDRNLEAVGNRAAQSTAEPASDSNSADDLALGATYRA
jgi:hypothetical protein